MRRLWFLATLTASLLNNIVSEECDVADPSIVSANLNIYPEYNNENRKTPLYVGLIQSYDPSDKQLNAVGTVVGTEVALDHINADESLLPGYTLHYNFINSPV